MFTLHARLANRMCKQSFMVWYCLVYESNSKKKKKKMKNFGAYGRIGIFYLTLPHARIIFLVNDVI